MKVNKNSNHVKISNLQYIYNLEIANKKIDALQQENKQLKDLNNTLNADNKILYEALELELKLIKFCSKDMLGTRVSDDMKVQDFIDIARKNIDKNLNKD